MPFASSTLSLRRGLLFALVAAVGVATPVGLGSAADASDVLREAVRVGGQAVPAPRVAQALEICRTNLAQFGLHDCLERFWVPRFLLDQEAAAQKLAQRVAVAYRLDDLLHRALAESLARRKPTLTDAEVDGYIADHRRDFQKPLRIRLFRILFNDEEAARNLLAEMKSPVTVPQFRELARTHSVDHATHERGGDLGFVWPDGSTDIPQVSADKALYQAALELKDGELASRPISEGKRFAVLLRAGSAPEVPLDERSREIARLRLIEAATEAEIQTLLQKAKESDVKNRDDVLLGKLRRKEATLFSER